MNIFIQEKEEKNPLSTCHIFFMKCNKNIHINYTMLISR